MDKTLYLGVNTEHKVLVHDVRDERPWTMRIAEKLPPCPEDIVLEQVGIPLLAGTDKYRKLLLRIVADYRPGGLPYHFVVFGNRIPAIYYLNDVSEQLVYATCAATYCHIAMWGEFSEMPPAPGACVRVARLVRALAQDWGRQVRTWAAHDLAPQRPPARYLYDGLRAVGVLGK